MIKIEKTEVFGLEPTVRGCRNPLNSWSKSDSKWDDSGYYILGENDLSLMQKLSRAGTDHAKFRRMIAVYVDITAPLYWWKEFDTYKVGTVANSCSTMHKIHDKEFVLDDFSHEHLYSDELEVLKTLIETLNGARELYLDSHLKEDWWQMIQLLPTSYNQKRTVMMNYEVLHNIHHSRKDHKLDEWHILCDWIEKLPYAKGIIYD